MTERFDAVERLKLEMEGLGRKLPVWALAHALNERPRMEAALTGLAPDARSLLRRRLDGPSQRERLEAECSVLGAVEAILEAAAQSDQLRPLPPHVVSAFNKLAAPLRLRPCIAEYQEHGRRRTWPTLAPPEDHEFAGSAILTLWLLLQDWQRANRARLKRCENCKRWFVDRTRPGNAKRCRHCPAGKAWTRNRRRAAGHPSQLKGPTRRQRKKRRQRRKGER